MLLSPMLKTENLLPQLSLSNTLQKQPKQLAYLHKKRIRMVLSISSKESNMQKLCSKEKLNKSKNGI